ncbi:putative ribonuclease H-like domain-containing protein [Tanacetum coccineum]
MDLPYGKRAIGTKWVYRNKKDERGIIIRNKARLVAQGYTHEEGIDYDEVFDPVARIEAIRLFLAYASFKYFVIYKMDVKSAFLYGKIDKEVYVCQPLGFEDPEFPNKVYKVEKAYVYIKLLDLSSTPMETSKPLLKDAEAEDVDYPKDSPFDLKAYTDSDYAGASLDRKSTTRGCQFLGRRLISWQCKKQIIVSNSTTEAEYVAASSCCRQVLWIQNQMLDYGYNFMNTKIFIDNESTICIVKNLVFHSKTKHIGIRHHFVRDSYEKRLIQVIKIHTNHNVADLLTKAFDVSKFQYLIAKNETVIKEWEDRMEKVAITASSLEAEQDSELERMGAKTTAWKEFSSTMASAIICLATNQIFNFSKYIFDNMVKNLEGGVKFLMYPRFVQVFLDKQVDDMSKHKEIYVTPSHTKEIFANMKREGKEFSSRITPLFQTMMVQAPEVVGEGSAVPTDSHHTTTQPSTSRPQKKHTIRKQRKDSGPTEPITDKATNEEHVSTPSYDPSQSEIFTLKKRVKKLEKKIRSKTYKPRRLYKVGLSRRIESSDDVSLGTQEDASKQGRKIAELDANTEVTLIDETQGRNNEDLMFDTGVLNGDEVFQEPIVNTATKSSILVSAADLVTTASEVVTTANVEIPEELTLA